MTALPPAGFEEAGLSQLRHLQRLQHLYRNLFLYRNSFPLCGAPVRLFARDQRPHDTSVLVRDSHAGFRRAQAALLVCNPETAPIGLRLARYTTERAPWIRRVRRYESPRLLIPNSRVFPPLECCLGTKPNQAANCRPFLKVLPSLMAATQSCCYQRTNSFHRRDSLAGLAGLIDGPDFLVDGLDLFFQRQQFVVERSK